MPICWARISRRERPWCSSTSRKAAERAEQTLRRSTYHVVAPHHAADGPHLWRALCRSRRPHPRHLRRDLAVRLGAPRKRAAAAAARLGEGEPCRGGEEAEVNTQHTHRRPRERGDPSPRVLVV